MLGRWIAIVDPKGEYAGVAERLGLAVVKLQPGGEQRLNPLHRAAGADHHDDGVRQATMVAALVASVLRRDLTPLEDAALGWTTSHLARNMAEPTLADLAACLASPSKTMGERAHMTPTQLARGTDDVVFGLGKLLDRSLRGMFDGPSTIELQADGPGVVIDLSAVHNDPDALGLVMIAATAWLQSVLAQPGPPRLQVLDEAWALLANERAARYLQACFKLGRSYGVANIAIVHRLSDLRAQADDGTALAKVTRALVADSGTHVLFRHGKREDAETTVTELSLPASAVAVLQKLPMHRALVHCGGQIAVVEVRFNDTLTHLAYTNQAMGRVA